MQSAFSLRTGVVSAKAVLRQLCPATIPRMTNLTSVLKYLEQERNRVGAQLERLNHALSVLIGTSNRRARRTISAAGRARIAAAQRARWAKVKGQKVVSILARKGRTMSPAARKKIGAAQKARWAKWRTAQKKA
jgi:3-oxoacyl-ACP reductase-like protein